MECSVCQNILISSFRCRYCSETLCSLNCLELHCSKFHLIKKNIIIGTSKINSPYLLQGFLNSNITYDSFYSLDNFVPIYDENGKMQIIGSGSYGQVYLALHILNKKYYAIKHMDKKKLFSLLHSLNSIQKEIDIQSKIDHHNIVKLLYVKETHISYDLVMEYASLGSLFHYIRKYKGLNENKTFSLFIQVVNAVNFMHSNDLIHRDIKPENILIFENNIIKLCDFGWCVKLDGHQRGTFCGTTEYMSPELVNHQGYGKEIDVWSLGILLYEMIHGYSPFRPNKPKFNEKDVMENIKNHNLIFGKTVSNECKNLIYHLLDPDINKRYTVEDIYNSEFVKKYEKMHYCFPDINLVQLYNKKIEKEQNIDNNVENININNINNILNSQVEINKYSSFTNNLIYLSNNYQLQDSRNIFNNNITKNINLTNYDLSRGNYFNEINNVDLNVQNLNNNKCSNNINILFNNNQRDIVSKSEINNIYNNNSDNKENILYLLNDEKHPQDKKNNKENINYNNNSFHVFTGDNKNNSMNIINNDKNYLNQINNKIWNNSNDNISQLNDLSNNNYIQINQNNNQNIPITKNIDNKSVNYNYYYNFNSYNNNFTNNFFNNNYNQISPNALPKKIYISNYNINSENSNMNNSNINIIIDKNNTVSTIPTTSNKTNQGNENIIIKQKKVSEFEVGEEKYNLSDKEQNENDFSSIIINMNHEHQRINNRKYLSRSDYSIINKKKKDERIKNIFIKKLDIEGIKVNNINKINNSERINDENKDISNIEKVEQHLLKNKIYKNKRDNYYKIITNLSEPNLKKKDITKKKNIEITNSNFPEKLKINRLLSERNINGLDKKGKSPNLVNEKLSEKINKEKKDYNNNLRNKIIDKKNNPIKKDESNKKDNYIGDLLCSLFNVFDSKKDRKNEINIMKKESHYSNNTHKALITKLSNKEEMNDDNIKNIKNNSMIKIEKDNKKFSKNSSFIRINNKKNKLICLNISKFGDNNFERNNRNKNKIKNITNTQPNLDNKENDKNIFNNKNILRHHVSSNDIKITKKNKIKINNIHKIIEIPINTKDINIIYKNNKNLDDNANINNSKIITPKKRYIFNRIHPFKLLGAFKKELTDYSIHNSKLSMKK